MKGGTKGFEKGGSRPHLHGYDPFADLPEDDPSLTAPGVGPRYPFVGDICGSGGSGGIGGIGASRTIVSIVWHASGDGVGNGVVAGCSAGSGCCASGAGSAPRGAPGGVGPRGAVGAGIDGFAID